MVKDQVTIIEPRRAFSFKVFKEIWDYRELLFFLSMRDIRIRYKQTVLGILWAIIQPFMIMVVFSYFFGTLGKLNQKLPEGFPSRYYPLFVYAALLLWQIFAKGLQDTAQSLVSNASLVTKVYFPRLIIPLSSVLSGLVDFFFSFLVFVGMMFYFHIPLTITFLLFPFFVLLASITAFAIGTFFSALNVKYRDVRYTIPFLVQLWLFASPVVYGTAMLPRSLHWLYSFNPMVGVIEGFRWAVLGNSAFNAVILIPSFLTIVFFMFLSIWYFFRVEGEMADLI